jgi:hypothetical protein
MTRAACSLYFSADGKDLSTWARSPEHLLEVCDVVIRLLAVGLVHSLVISAWSSVNARTVEYLMEQC